MAFRNPWRTKERVQRPHSVKIEDGEKPTEISKMSLLHTPHPSTTTGKLFQQRGGSRVADSGARMVPETPFRRSSGNATGALILRLKPTHRIALSSVGSGSWKEGNRRVQAESDGIAPENAEAESREQILEQARAESASTIDDEQEPFRGSVESGTIGEATTELQFGTGDSNTSNELSKQGKSGGAIKEEDKAKEDPKAELTSELWGSKDEGGSTHAFLDDEKKVDFRGEEDESVLGELGSWRRSYRKPD